MTGEADRGSLPKHLMDLFESMGRQVLWGDVHDFDHMDERVAAANVCFDNLIGVNRGNIQWCPNEIPPSRDEILAWLWVCRPELAREIMNCAGSDLADTIRESL